MPVIMIAGGKKGGKPSMEPPPFPSSKKPKGMPPPKAQPPMMDDPDEANEPEESAHSVGPEDVDYSSDDLCGSCAHMGQDGSCEKYGFPVSETGHCEAGFTPKEGEVGEGEGGEGEPPQVA